MTFRRSSCAPCEASSKRIPVREDLFEELVASVREGGAILRGEAAPSRTFPVGSPDVREIRARFQLSQSEFAALLGISVGTLRTGSRAGAGPRDPRAAAAGPARHPDAVWDVVRSDAERAK